MKQAARLWMLAAALLAFTLLGAAIASAQSYSLQLRVAPQLTASVSQGGEVEAGAEEAHGKGGEHYELPNFMEWIYKLNREPIDAWLAGVNAGLPHLLQFDWGNITNLTFCWLVVIILCAVAIIGTRKRSPKTKDRLYLFLELVVTFLYGFFHQVLGKDTRKYIGLIGTLFIYILCLNLFGLIPLMKAPSSVWGINVAMALFVFFYVQYTAIARNGFGGYLKHLCGEPIWLAPLMFPLHLVGELIKPVSLSLRLFGNILGEDTLLAVFAGLLFLKPIWLSSPIWILFFALVALLLDRRALITVVVVAVLLLGAGRILGAGGDPLPLHLPFMFMALLFSTIQALIFSMLTAVYISLMLPHKEHGH